MQRCLKLPVMTVCLLVMGGAGCASKNYSTTLAPHQTVLEGFEARFRINHVDALPPLIFYMSGYTDSTYWEEKIPDVSLTHDFPQQLRDLLAEKYPKVFCGDPAALPVDVRLHISGFHETSKSSSMLASLSWGIFGIILPLPIAMRYDCSVNVEFPDLADRQSTQFRNRLFTWVSFPSPLALIPVPASADRRAGGIYPLQSTYYSGRLFTLECFAEAVVHAINKFDTESINAAYRKRRALRDAGQFQ